MKTIFLFVFLLWMPVLLGSSDAPFQVSLLPGSRLAIEGSSTVNRFTCEAGVLRGAGRFQAGRAEARLVVPVETFDCGKERMNRDLQEALKADLHPEIRFEMTESRVTGSPAGLGKMIQLAGRLTIAGTTRLVDVESEVERLSDTTYRVQGSKALRMSDFGIDPPSVLAGLIRAHDRIVVQFDLLATTHVTEDGRISPAAILSRRE